MNINHLSLPDYISSSGVCKRAKLDTGTFCNMGCSFCYYKDHLNVKTPKETIFKRIDYLRNMGVIEVDLSGGESSIHKDWFEILEYCKNMKISCLSNGWKFSDLTFMKKSKELGLSEILFSLHGYNQKTHDLIVDKKGAFNRIIKSIKNAHRLNIKVRINCVVNEINYNDLHTKFTELVNTLEVFEVNFITINTWEDNNLSTNYKKLIENVKLSIPKINAIVNVRYVPYCYMKGFEENVCDWYQHIYDIYDWNMNLYDYNTTSNTVHDMYKVAGEYRLQFYTKPRECLKCKYFKICDGIDSDIEIYPQKGEMIQDVNYFRKDFYVRNDD